MRIEELIIQIVINERHSDRQKKIYSVFLKAC
jgi:hypothetical protein